MSLPELPELKLPFWMNGPHAATLVRAARRWWLDVGDWAAFPLRQIDPMTCTVRMLDLVAWQRHIARIPKEGDRMYRLRVDHAYRNAVDSGQIAGWQRIFERLEIPLKGFEERIEGQDWDIIGVYLGDPVLSAFQNVIEWIVDDYGRTCRRYHLVSRYRHDVNVRIGTFDNDHATVCAALDTTARAALHVRRSTFDGNHGTVRAVITV